MKVIITETGEKRYRFEDTDSRARKQFEENISASDTDISKLLIDILEKIGQRRMEGWTNAHKMITEIDPNADLEDIGYDWFSGEFKRTSKR